MRILPQDLGVFAKARRPGFADAVLKVARVDGDHIVVASDDWLRLTLEYHMKAQREPTVADLATNAAYAAWRATVAGLQGGRVLLSWAEQNERGGICNGCDQWDASAHLRLGKCNHPGCGCTVLKRWLATERCPLGKWPAAAARAESGAAAGETPPPEL